MKALGLTVKRRESGSYAYVSADIGVRPTIASHAATLHDPYGEPLEMHSLGFDIDSPLKVIDAFKSLDIDGPEEEFAPAQQCSGRGIRIPSIQNGRRQTINCTRPGPAQSSAALRYRGGDLRERSIPLAGRGNSSSLSRCA